MLSLEELRQMVRIDLSHLDEECSTHAELYMEACDLQASAKADAKAAKHNLECVKGCIMLDYRSGALKADVKITETSIVALVDAHEDVIQAKDQLVVAERHSYRCDSLVNAFDHRRTMLSNEVSLYQSQYYHNADGMGKSINTYASTDVESLIANKRTSRQKGIKND